MRPATDLDVMFRQLAAKYAVKAPEHWILAQAAESPPNGRTALVPGWTLLDNVAPGHLGRCVPLFPWRCERRFVELKCLVDGSVVAPVVMCRFGCLTTGAPMGLKALLYREFDLIEWLTGSPIVTVYASAAAERFANVLVRVQSGVVCSVEAGVTLPPNARPPVVDRHELIARRGVASDRVVDTQLPQSSVYTFTDKGADSYTDADAELFGLDTDDATLVRAACDLAARPDLGDALWKQHRRLVRLVELVGESDRRRQRLFVEGVDSCGR